MRHEALIEGTKVCASAEYIVHSDEKGVVAECQTLEEAKQAFLLEEAKCREWGVEPHLAIFRWSGSQWKPAISLYQLEEAHLEKHPSEMVRFP